MYMAPEQVMKQEYSEAVDWCVDIASCCVLWFEFTLMCLSQVGSWRFGVGDADQQEPVRG